MKKNYIKPEIEIISVEAEKFMSASEGKRDLRWNPNGTGIGIKIEEETDGDIGDDDLIG